MTYLQIISLLHWTICSNWMSWPQSCCNVLTYMLPYLYVCLPEIGIGLMGFSLFFLLFGVLSYFDSVLLAFGNVSNLSCHTHLLSAHHTTTGSYQHPKTKPADYNLWGQFSGHYGRFHIIHSNFIKCSYSKVDYIYEASSSCQIKVKKYNTVFVVEYYYSLQSESLLTVRSRVTVVLYEWDLNHICCLKGY